MVDTVYNSFVLQMGNSSRCALSGIEMHLLESLKSNGEVEVVDATFESRL